MFKCKECGTEYKEKPDYCDCGNDTFEEIAETPIPPKPAETKPTNIRISQPQPAPKPVPQYRNYQQSARTDYNSSFNTRNEDSHVSNSGDILSLGLFILSIGLAVCTLFIFGNPKEEAVQQTKTETTQTAAINIPNVDSYWDNSTAGMSNATTEIQIPEEQPVQAEQPQPKEPSTPVMSKFDEWLNRPKRVAEETPKYTPTPAQTQPKQQTTVQTKPKQTTQTKQQPVSTGNAKINSPGAPNDLLTRVQNNIQFTNTNKNTTTTTTPTKTTTTTPTKTTNTTTNKQTTVSKPATTKPATTATTQTPPTLRNATTQPVKSSAELQQEVASYKNSLRNNLGRKINFANVIGDGNCSITFKVDSSGKLTNRNFATKSSNITLNDAVYSAMMSTPSYNPPPEGYKGETMTLRVKIYDGNYEITLN